jgi:hypothetical protein
MSQEWAAVGQHDGRPIGEAWEDQLPSNRFTVRPLTVRASERVRGITGPGRMRLERLAHICDLLPADPQSLRDGEIGLVPGMPPNKRLTAQPEVLRARRGTWTHSIPPALEEKAKRATKRP